MADGTKIEWADATLNYINGCSVHTPGCTNCYAMKQAHRFPVRQGLTQQSKGGMVWTGEVRAHEPALMQALSWKRGRRIFWNAHGDTFHENVPDEWIDRLLAVCVLTPQHTHMILTKRSGRMREYFAGPLVSARVTGEAMGLVLESLNHSRRSTLGKGVIVDFGDVGPAKLVNWPLPNVWLGVSVEDQQRADERIPDLLATPAAVRFLSCEPLLGPIALGGFPVPDRPLLLWNALTGEQHCGPLVHADTARIDWVIAGGESGPKARPMHPDWARGLRDQCAAAGVAFHFKQWGESCPLRNELIPVPRQHIGWVAEDGRYKFNVSEDEFQPMYRDDDEHGRAYWKQVVRVGKKRAGRLLDGRTHDEFPQVQHG